MDDESGDATEKFEMAVRPKVIYHASITKRPSFTEVRPLNVNF